MSVKVVGETVKCIKVLVWILSNFASYLISCNQTLGSELVSADLAAR